MSTYSQFKISLSLASKAQGQASPLWHEAFRHAITIASDENRNIQCLNTLLLEVYKHKQLTIMPLVKAVVELSGGVENGMITFDPGNKKESIAPHFRVRKDKERKSEVLIPEKGVELARKLPWWDIAPAEKVTKLKEFKALISTVKSISNAVDDKKALLSDLEAKALYEIEMVLVKHFGSAVFESKRGKN